MNIAYNKVPCNVASITEMDSIPHQVLHPDIQQYIKNHHKEQAWYHIDSNDWYFFIYFDNGERIDIKLN